MEGSQDENNIFLQQKTLLTSVNNLYNQLFGSTSSNNTPNIPHPSDLIPIMNKLTEAINNLSAQIAKLATILSNNSTTISPQYRMQPHGFRTPTFADVLQNNLGGTNHQQHMRTDLSQQRKPNEQEFIQKLAALKNTRNEAYFRMRRNELIAKLYEECLQSKPQKVPRKCLSSMVCHRNEALLQQRNKLSIQCVENEIAVMRIHQDRQNTKMLRYDKMVYDLIATESNLLKQKQLLDKYQKILHSAKASTEKKLASTIDFLSGSQHMAVLHERRNSVDQQEFTLSKENITPSTNQINDEEIASSPTELVNINISALSSTDLINGQDNTTRSIELPNNQGETAPLTELASDQEMLLTNNLLKRGYASCQSTSSKSSNNSSSTKKQSQRSPIWTRPLPKRPTQRHSNATPKN